MSRKSGGIAVLHVDDEPDFGEMASRFIEGHDERLQVETATSAREGLDRLAEKEFDCIVSDYDMPAEDGIEFLEAVRESYPELPFILYTGKGSEEVASDAISVGVTDYLQKGPGTSQYEVLANRITNAVEQRRARQEAAQTEQRLKTIAENSKDILWKFTADWNELLFINSSYEEIWGRSVAELRENPRSFLKGVHPDDRDRVREAMRTLSEGDAVDLEFRVNAAEDFERWVWVQGEPILEESGAVVKVVGFARDITERKAESERFEMLIEHSNDIITVVDEEGAITYESPSVERVLGYDQEALIGESGFDYIHPDDRHRVFELFNELTAQPATESGRITYRFKHADGSWVWLETVGRVDPQSPIDGYVLNSRDITERKRREQVLEEQRSDLRIFERAVEGSTDLLAAVDPEYNLIFANRQYRSYHGLSEDDIGEISLPDLLAGTWNAEVKGKVDRALAGEELRYEMRRESSDGDSIALDISYYPLTDDDDTVIGAVAAMRDITEFERNRALIEALSTSLPEYTFIYDEQGVYLDAITGWESGEELYQAEELVGKNVSEVFPPETATQIQTAIETALTSGEPRTIEYAVDPENGPRWYEATVVPIPEGYRDEPAVLLTAHHVTERREHAAKVTALHDVAEDLTRLDSAQAVCERTVEASKDILQFDLSVIDLEEGGMLRKAAVSEDIPPGNLGDMSVNEGIAGKTYRTGESFVIGDLPAHEDANPQGPYESVVSVAIGDHGIFQAASKSPDEFDETDLELAELLISHCESALDRIEREQALKRQNDRLDEFAGLVSHDLQNPLTVAKGRLELATEECESDHLQAVANAHDRMELLIEDMLALAQAGDTVGDIEAIQLPALVEACWSQVVAGGAELEIETEASVRGDRSRVRQLLENLFRNSIEHGGQGVTVTVGDTPDGFYIEDDGPGIHEAVRGEVFDPGYTTSENGNGFGLSIVRDIAEAHGWTVDIASSESGGARFEITGVEFAD